MLMKPNTPVTSLRRATSAYTHSKRYLLACAQPDAYRHGIDGNPSTPVSAEDRTAAQLAFSKLKKGASEPPSPPPQPAQPTPDISRANQIRAGILGRSQRKANSI
jgi:ProP effector